MKDLPTMRISKRAYLALRHLGLLGELEGMRLVIVGDG